MNTLNLSWISTEPLPNLHQTSDKMLPSHCVLFSQLYKHFWANLVMHICSMSFIIAIIWYQGLILNSRRLYTNFDPKRPVLRANSGCQLNHENCTCSYIDVLWFMGQEIWKSKNLFLLISPKSYQLLIQVPP